MSNPFKRTVKQTTAKSILEVMWWIETNNHHIIDASSETHVELRGYDAKLRVAMSLWRQCFTKAGSEHDKRALRWDHKAHKEAVEKEGKGPQIGDLFYSHDFEIYGVFIDHKTYYNKYEINKKIDEEYIVDYTNDNNGWPPTLLFSDDIVWIQHKGYWTEA